MRSFTYRGHQVHVKLGRYANGRMAVRLVATDGEPVATASVNMPDQPCDPDEVWVKDYSENEGMAAFLIQAGLVAPNCTEACRAGYITVFKYRATRELMQQSSLSSGL